MKYFVAHPLQGPAYEYHRALTRALADRFRITPLHEKIEPHLTVKIPFAATDEQLAAVERSLAAFAAAHDPVPYELAGFGRFGHRTVFIDVPRSRDAVMLVRACVQDLNTHPWMQQVPHEGMKLHSSVARYLDRRQFRRVWRTVRHERPHFRAAFDRLTIFKKESPSAMWAVHREFMLGRGIVPAWNFSNTFATPAVS